MLLSLFLQNAARKCTRVLHDIFSDFKRKQLLAIPVGAAVNVNSLMPAKYALVINTIHSMKNMDASVCKGNLLFILCLP